MKTVSQRMLDVQTPVIPLVGELIAANPGTISLGQGIVHYDPPSAITDAVYAALRRKPAMHRYGLVSGLADFQDVIREKLADHNDIQISSEQRIIVTAGSNMAFLNAILAIADPGDEIIIMAPYYFNHEMAIGIADCHPVVVSTTDDYQLDLDAIEAAISPRTRAIVTISPNNPTGAVYHKEDLCKLNQLCGEKGIFHISDEAYEYFLYDAQSHFSPGSITDSHKHTISLFSLSKSYGMAGWRIAYMLIPESLEVAVKKIQDTNLICPPLVSQMAAMAAMKEGKPWIDDQVSDFSEVRKLVLDALADLGDKISVPVPGGAFYALMRLEKECDDMAIVRELVEKYKVAVMPGSTFGVKDSTCLRIAYGALQKETVEEGMGRLVNGLQDLLS